MPTYSYACTECGHAFDIYQSFTEETLAICPQCQGKLRKKFNSVGVVFKGSGFYRTDSRAEARSEANSGTRNSKSSASSDPSSSAGSGSSGSGSKGSGSSGSEASSSSTSAGSSSSSSSSSGGSAASSSSQSK